ncbi:MAG: hypothetical protein M3Q10_00110 [Chloroflexota bacterium]|nr:hypothetical protein [Chloroflexota bacterium]
MIDPNRRSRQATPARECGASVAPPPPPSDHRPTPYPVVVRHLSLADLHRATDRLLGDMRSCAATYDPDGEEWAERRVQIVRDEIERRDAKRVEREAKRQARIRVESDAWYATHGGGR